MSQLDHRLVEAAAAGDHGAEEPPLPPPPEEEDTEPPDSGAFTYYMFHPYGRLFTAVNLTVWNLLLYGEDPVMHSYVEVEFPLAGQAYNMLLGDWPDVGWLVFVKVVLALVCLFVGAVVGRVVLHDMLLRDILRLGFCGWHYSDLDDVRTSEVYWPFTKHGNTPYNLMWWQGVDKKDLVEVPPELTEKIRAAHELDEADPEIRETMEAVVREAYEEGWETGMMAARKSHAGKLRRRLFGRAGGYTRADYDYSKEEYVAEHMTYLEEWLPRVFKPRKHRDHSKGSVICMVFGAVLTMALGAWIYNLGFLTMAYSSEADLKRYTVGPGVGFTEYEMGKITAVITWFGDLANLVTAFDSTFQELGKHRVRIRTEEGGGEGAFGLLAANAYKRPRIAAVHDADAKVRRVAGWFEQATPRMKLGYANLGELCGFSEFWIKDLGCDVQVRHVVVLFISLAMTIFLLISVLMDVVRWDDWTERYGFNLHSGEFARLVIASTIAVQGPMTIIQDLEWPSFDTNDPEVKLPGLNVDHISCDWCCSMTRRGEAPDGASKKLPFTTFFVTNKWLTFIPFAMSLVLDHAMLYACWEYHPALYGQYVNPENNTICTTTNETHATMIKDAYEAKDFELVDDLANYTVRLDEGYLDANGTDFCVPSKYLGTSNAVKFFVAAPGACMYLVFIVLLFYWTKKNRRIRAWEEKPVEDPPADGSALPVISLPPPDVPAATFSNFNDTDRDRLTGVHPSPSGLRDPLANTRPTRGRSGLLELPNNAQPQPLRSPSFARPHSDDSIAPPLDGTSSGAPAPMRTLDSALLTPPSQQASPRPTSSPRITTDDL